MASVSLIRAAVLALLLCNPATADDAREGKPPPSNGKQRPTGATGSTATPSLPPPLPLQPETSPEPGPDATTPAGPGSSDSDGKDNDRLPRSSPTAELLLHVDKERFDIPITFTPEVIRWVEWFTANRTGRATIQRWLARSTRYKDMMQAELIRSRLPTDLIYLAMIESGFSVHAESHAQAVGPWQFIQPTALQYGLRVDGWIDERRDPLRSTQAAARYLSKLKNDFGNWYMAFASYNAGEGLVFSSIRSYGTIDFWGLSRIGALPAETRDYVPKLIAAAVVSKNLDLFGFDQIDYEPPVTWEVVEVNAGTLVVDLARAAALDEGAFLEYNPHILTDRLPPEPEKQEVYLPSGSRVSFYAAIRGRSVSPASAGRRIAVPPEEVPDLSHHVKTFNHTVAAGETLAGVAEQHGLSVAVLCQLNQLTPEAALTPGQVLKTTAPPTARWTSHEVRKGETLATIAKRYGCTVEQLRGWNALEEEVIRPEPGVVLWLEAAR